MRKVTAVAVLLFLLISGTNLQRSFAFRQAQSQPPREDAYRREGDIRELLTRTDDMFVIARPGDEISLKFDAQSLPTLRAG